MAIIRLSKWRNNRGELPIDILLVDTEFLKGGSIDLPLVTLIEQISVL